MDPGMPDFTPSHELFCTVVAGGFDPGCAALVAGFGTEDAQAAGAALLGDQRVRVRIARILWERQEKDRQARERLLSRLERLADRAVAVGRTGDALGALTTLGRIRGELDPAREVLARRPARMLETLLEDADRMSVPDHVGRLLALAEAEAQAEEEAFARSAAAEGARLDEDAPGGGVAAPAYRIPHADPVLDPGPHEPPRTPTQVRGPASPRIRRTAPGIAA